MAPKRYNMSLHTSYIDHMRYPREETQLHLAITYLLCSLQLEAKKLRNQFSNKINSCQIFMMVNRKIPGSLGVDTKYYSW